MPTEKQISSVMKPWLSCEFCSALLNKATTGILMAFVSLAVTFKLECSFSDKPNHRGCVFGVRYHYLLKADLSSYFTRMQLHSAKLQSCGKGLLVFRDFHYLFWKRKGCKRKVTPNLSQKRRPMSVRFKTQSELSGHPAGCSSVCWMNTN